MVADNKTIEEKVNLLKESRLEFLKIHKLLVDFERNKYENLNGKISSGQFLNLLVNDSNFEWLRKFSILIVEIDEMLDLDDGYTEEMIEKNFTQMRKILELNSPDEEFNKKYRESLQSIQEVSDKNDNLKQLLQVT